MLIDIGKGWVATALLPSLDIPFVGLDPDVDRQWLAVACATAAVVGHVYPVWFGFRGGKGAATLVGVLAGLHPAALLPVLVVWIAVVVLSGFVGLATMLAVVSFPIYIAITSERPSAALLCFGCAMMIFVCYTHRSNIARMLDGSENRARRLWLFGRR
jgi:glycerol-3-phosphate acyltransferase PlsY